MIKCKVSPDQTNYAIKEGKDTIMTELAGGRARYRRDLVGSSVEIEVQWTLNPTEYQYLRAFYNYLNKGADAFVIDLLYETATMREYIAQFKPGTWKLSGVKGQAFTVRSTLEVMPNDEGLDYADIVSNFTPEPYVVPPPPSDFGGE